MTTHHHWDHAGGNVKLLQKVPGVVCYGGSDQVKGVTHIVANNNPFKVGALTIRPMATFGHTMDHICYYVQDKDSQHAVFTGDCLFSSGCGRIFEGSADDMHRALTAIRELPKECKIYFGHEYTLSNLKFAQHVESDNADIRDKVTWARSVGSTTPSTVQNEILTNPFMRVAEKPVREWALREAGLSSAKPDQVLGILRKAKDNF
ncbi:hypothetical protein DFQ28_005864 [Apophysomyces sp. BC1034]|nr:hypothetical protein DFQ30_003948 [Apophysomyces sp. BC1015]KAG0176208.1 hypothetical protein DFQ29_006411 [Apophysomyces sp. BC1021]KAG0193247.1 hypothetical protein DFQ28_005864 [Apophysomyces sp. BC1034]